MLRRMIALPAAALVLAATACGGGGGPAGLPDGTFAFAANSSLVTGTERLLVALASDDGRRLASPDVAVSVRVWPDGDPAAAREVTTTFMWVVEGVSGLYRASVPFDRAGIWNVEVLGEGERRLDPFPVMVADDAAMPLPGDPAPPSASVTIAEAPLEEITTDPEPDPRFYRMSVAEAVTSGRSSVIVFATPKFCQTAMCGPVLETLRGLAPGRPDVNWVHVEVYADIDDPEHLEVVPAVTEWGLETEPWVFVVDAAGIVVARFEGVVTSGEIEAALAP